jgi:hypothetical protein
MKVSSNSLALFPRYHFTLTGSKARKLLHILQDAPELRDLYSPLHQELFKNADL